MSSPSGVAESGGALGNEAVPVSGAPVDRKAAFAAGPPGISRKAIGIGLGVMAVIALLGSVLEKVMSDAGLNPVASTTTAPRSHGVRAVVVPADTLPGGKSLAEFLGAERLAANPAPTFQLASNRGGPLSPAALHGKAVVLAFFDSACDDLCPVLGAELVAADRELGAAASRVRLVVINSDPVVTADRVDPPAMRETGLQGLANTAFLTAPLSSLNAVWKAYGISVQVGAGNQIAHNDFLYFLSPKGTLTYRVTPYADEGRNGTYHLAAPLERRWAEGIATYARSLLSGAGTHR